MALPQITLERPVAAPTRPTNWAGLLIVIAIAADALFGGHQLLAQRGANCTVWSMTGPMRFEIHATHAVDNCANIIANSDGLTADQNAAFPGATTAPMTCDIKRDKHEFRVYDAGSDGEGQSLCQQFSE